MVNRTAKDGRTTVEAVELDGRTYDLPPWLSVEEFTTGLRSNDPGDPLSTLSSLTLKGWERSPYGYSEPDVPIFDAVFEVPHGGIYELVYDRFAPAWQDAEYEREIEVHDEFIRVSFPVREYMDFNDVQLISFPKEIPSYESDSLMNQSVYEEMTQDFAEFKRQTVGWDGHYEEFTKDGVDSFLFLKVHED